MSHKCLYYGRSLSWFSYSSFAAYNPPRPEGWVGQIPGGGLLKMSLDLFLSVIFD